MTPGTMLEKPLALLSRQPMLHVRTVPPVSLEHPMGPSVPPRVPGAVPLDTLERVSKFRKPSSAMTPKRSPNVRCPRSRGGSKTH